MVSVDYTQITNKPTVCNSRTSLLVADKPIDLINQYKIINSIDPTNAQDLVTLNYLNNTVNNLTLSYNRLTSVPQYFDTKTSMITADNNFDFNSFKGINLADPSGPDNKEAVNVGYLNTRLNSFIQQLKIIA